MRLRYFLMLTAAAVLIEVVAIKYWIASAGFDCYPNCDTGQVVSGWTAAIVPLLLVTVLAVSIVRWLLSRRGDGRKGRT